jgi:hypothetical protein
MSVPTNLTPLRVPPTRTAINAAPKPAPAAVPRPTELSVEDGRALSIETINTLVKENPALVARLITDAGQRARGVVSTPRASLSRTALAFLLVDEKMRGKQLSDADAAFLAAVVEDMTRHE